jgi:hypothetical protein
VPGLRPFAATNVLDIFSRGHAFEDCALYGYLLLAWVIVEA